MAEFGRRKVLSYSDSYAAPSGDVDLDAPLPSLVPAPTLPAPTARKTAGRSVSSAPLAHLGAPVASAPHSSLYPQPWYGGPPPPLYALHDSLSVYVPYPQTHPPLQSHVSGLHYPCPRPAGYLQHGHAIPFRLPHSWPSPAEPNFASAHTSPPMFSHHQSLGRTPTPTATSFSLPSPSPRRPWPFSSRKAWANVVIEDCDSSDDHDVNELGSEIDGDGGSASSATADDAMVHCRVLARRRRHKTTQDMLFLLKKLRASERGAEDPSASSAKDLAKAVDVTITTPEPEKVLTEYEKKQQQITEMMEKIYRLEQAARKRKSGDWAAGSATEDATNGDSKGISLPKQDSTPDAQGSAAGPSAGLPADLAEKRARLIASMRQIRKRKAIEYVAPSAISLPEAQCFELQSQSAHEDKQFGDRKAHMMGDSQASLSAHKNAELMNPSLQASATPEQDERRSRKSQKRQRKRERKRRDEEAQEHEALLASGS